jgi:hypothetical protein
MPRIFSVLTPLDWALSGEAAVAAKAAALAVAMKLRRFNFFLMAVPPVLFFYHA